MKHDVITHLVMLIAAAPKEPQPWFMPNLNPNDEVRLQSWPLAWAHTQHRQIREEVRCWSELCEDPLLSRLDQPAPELKWPVNRHDPLGKGAEQYLRVIDALGMELAATAKRHQRWIPFSEQEPPKTERDNSGDHKRFLLTRVVLGEPETFVATAWWCEMNCEWIMLSNVEYFRVKLPFEPTHWANTLPLPEPIKL